MKILMLGWELPPHNSGGLGVACLHLSKSLAKLGADIDFVVPYEAEHNFDYMNVLSAGHVDPEMIYKGSAYISANIEEKRFKFIRKTEIESNQEQAPIFFLITNQVEDSDEISYEILSSECINYADVYLMEVLLYRDEDIIKPEPTKKSFFKSKLKKYFK